MDQLLSVVFPQAVTSALLIATLAILTGGLHLDGLADTCDGIFNRGEPERRMEIMHDSRTGAFGVVGLITLLLVKYTALVSMSPSIRPVGLIIMATAARLAMAYCVVYFPYARAAGLGKMVQGGRRTIPLAMNTAFVVVVAYFLLGNLGLMSLLVSGLVVWLGALYIMTKIPGLTGDTYGALCELGEVAILLTLVAGR